MINIFVIKSKYFPNHIESKRNYVRKTSRPPPYPSVPTAEIDIIQTPASGQLMLPTRGLRFPRLRRRLLGLIATTFVAQWLLRLAFCAICYGLCLWQVIDVFCKYYSFPVEVNVMVEEMKELHLPAITICNNNIILRSELRRHYPESDNLNDSQQFKDFLNELLKRVPLRTLIKYAQSSSSFVTEMRCNGGRTGEPCADQPVVASLQRNGICFTYFHGMAGTLRKTNSRKKVDSPLGSDSTGLDANEIARFTIDFRPDEYADTELPVSGSLSIGHNLEVSNALSSGYTLEPGKMYQFYVTRKTTKLMPSPYQTHCFDYFNNNSARLLSSGDFMIPLTRNQCAAVCAARFSIDFCRCWPPDLPYIANNELEVYNQTHTLEWCDWRNKDDPTMSTLCYDRKRRIDCAIGCQPNCETDRYDVSVERLAYPYKRVERYTAADLTSRNCCAIVSVRYWSTERTTHKYSPKFTFVVMFCYVGGLVSMYIGISFITCYDLALVIAIKFGAVWSKYFGDQSRVLRMH